MEKLYERLSKARIDVCDDDFLWTVDSWLAYTGQTENFLKFVDKLVKASPSRIYDKEYGDDKVCKCGHPYYRHFDTYEDMRNVGCKYCRCRNFAPA